MSKTRTRIGSLLLAVLMLLSLLPVSALATDGNSNDNSGVSTQEATSLPEAVNGVITLEENVTINSALSISSANANTIDLNGFTLSVTRLDSYTDLTIRDSSASGNGVLTSSASITCVVWGGYSITLESGTIQNTNESGTTIFNLGTFTMNDGVISGDTVVYNTAKNGDDLIEGNIECNINGGEVQVGTWGIVALGAGLDEDGNADNDKVTVNITNGEIAGTGDCQAIATNASGGAYAGFTINISGGTIDGGSNGCGMYLPAVGVTNISGGTIKGAQAIRIAAGELYVTGGIVEGTAALTENTDLISGGSGGTEGAIVVGKAGNSGYVGNVIVDVSQNAVIRNSVEDGAAVVVSDKNMANDNYDDYSIEVSIEDVEVTGDIVKVSNLSSDSSTSDGGNTSLMLNNADITGNVINQTTGGALSIVGGTITGNVTNESLGSVVVDRATVDGTVTNTGRNDQKGSIAILNSTVTEIDDNTDQSITVVDSTIGNQAQGTDVLAIADSGFVRDPANADGEIKGNDWTYQTMYVTFEQEPADDTYLWFDIEAPDGTLYGIAAEGDGTSKTFAWSFLNKNQFEDWPDGVATGASVGNYTITSYLIVGAKAIPTERPAVDSLGLLEETTVSVSASDDETEFAAISDVYFKADADLANEGAGITDADKNTMWVEFSTPIKEAGYWLEVVDPDGDVYPMAGTEDADFVDSDGFSKLAWSFNNAVQMPDATIQPGEYQVNLYSFVLGTDETLSQTSRPSNSMLISSETITLVDVTFAAGEDGSFADGATTNFYAYVGDTISGIAPEVSSTTSRVFAGWSDGTNIVTTIPASEDGEVSLTATWRTQSGGTGGTTSYSIQVSDMTNGQVTASKRIAQRGEEVTLTVTPAEGYELGTLTVTDRNGDTVTLNQQTGRHLHLRHARLQRHHPGDVCRDGAGRAHPALHRCGGARLVL